MLNTHLNTCKDGSFFGQLKRYRLYGPTLDFDSMYYPLAFLRPKRFKEGGKPQGKLRNA